MLFRSTLVPFKIIAPAVTNIWQKQYQDELRCAVGISNNGEAYEFLAASVGHVLISCDVGSGKTNFLTTVILSLALNYSPRMFRFWVINPHREYRDFKGLPHCDLILDSSKENILHIISKLQDEFKHRQQMFIAEESVSRLIVVIDDVYELLDADPTFIDELTGWVREGRKLGVSFMLSTQNPKALPVTIYNQFLQIVLFLCSDEVAELVLGDQSYLTKDLKRGEAIIRSYNETKMVRIAHLSSQTQKYYIDLLKEM